MRVRCQYSPNREAQSLFQEKTVYALEKLLDLINMYEQEMGEHRKE